MAGTDEYISLRKKQADKLSKRFKRMRIFPIRKKKIVFSSFEGDGGFCCNPRYIAEELHRRLPDCKMIWLVKDTSKEFPDYIKPVKYTERNIAYHLSTAHIWVDNYRKPLGTLKRKGQIYLQTWHASLGFKAVGLFRGDAFPEIARLVSEWDSNLIDYMVSNSEYCDRIYPKKLLYSGPTLRVGSPRVDCLINNKKELRDRIRRIHNIDKDTRLLLYAPTFRGGNQSGQKQVIAPMPSVDFDRLLNALSISFGGEWKVLLRLHPQLAAKMDEMPLPKHDARLIDVSHDADISEVMGGCDAVLTDYSSCAFDAAFAGIPVFLYADDVEEYVKNRGKFMWEKGELPFNMAETNQELFTAVRKFELSEYRENIAAWMHKHGIVEDGYASSKCVDFLEKYL